MGKPKAKRQPYDSRTLLYVARRLTQECRALRDLSTRSGASKLHESSLIDRARQCEIHAEGFAREARDIERKAPK